MDIIKYFWDMWHKRIHTKERLTKLCSTKVNLIWNEEEYNNCTEMDKIVGMDSLLPCPHFIKEFLIQTDARNGGGV